MNKDLEELKELAENEEHFKSLRSQDFVIYYLIPVLEDFEKRIIKLEKKEESFGPKIRLIKEVPKRKPKTVQKIKVGGTDPD